MIKALHLIFRPTEGWQGLAEAKRSVGTVLLVHTMPLLFLSGVLEGIGLVNWGEPRGGFGRLKLFPVNEAVIFEVSQFLLSLLVVFAGAFLLKTFGATFHGRHTFRQAFTAVAYGLSPVFLFRILDALPWISPYLTWAVGICISIGILYHGVPIMMEPDPPHAFGLFLMSALVLCASTGLLRFVTAWYLKGKFPNLENAAISLAQQLPF